VTDKIDASELANSFTGFDEIAIRQRFGASAEDLSSTMLTRAVMFIIHRRDGAKDSDAYRSAMNLTLGELGDLFVSDDVPAASDEDPTRPGSQTS